MTKVVLAILLVLAYPMKSLGNSEQLPEEQARTPRHCQLYIEELARPERWSNIENIAFYEHMPVRSFEARAHSTHVDEHNDLKAAAEWIRAVAMPLQDWEEPVFLEVGAGYGRVVDYLRENYPTAKIQAYEHVPNLVKHLRRKYRHDKDVSIIGRNFLGRPPRMQGRRVRAQGVFLFWSPYIEFNRMEQFEVAKQIARSLDKNGIAIIDNPISYPPGGTIQVVSRRDGDEITLHQHDSVYHAFNPRPEYLHEQLRSAKLECVEEIDYRNGYYSRKIHIVAHQNRR